MAERKHLLVAPENVRKRVKTMIDFFGTVETAARLEMSRDAVARIAGGIPVRLGTLGLAEKYIENEDAKAKR